MPTTGQLITKKYVCSCGAILASPGFMGKVETVVIENGCPSCQAALRERDLRALGFEAFRAEDL